MQSPLSFLSKEPHGIMDSTRIKLLLPKQSDPRQGGHTLFFRQPPTILKLLHLAARRAHQILPATLADRRQILFADDGLIKHPYPSRFAIFALDHGMQSWEHRSEIDRRARLRKDKVATGN